MALTVLEYTKSWTDAEDFPTYESDEVQVRADMQFLYDEIRAYINETLLPELQSEISRLDGEIVTAEQSAKDYADDRIAQALVNLIIGTVSGVTVLIPYGQTLPVEQRTPGTFYNQVTAVL